MFFYQKKRIPNIIMIIIGFILTSCFYFPGLIHLYLKQMDKMRKFVYGEKSNKNIMVEAMVLLVAKGTVEDSTLFAVSRAVGGQQLHSVNNVIY